MSGPGGTGATQAGSRIEREVAIPASGSDLQGILAVPKGTCGLVIFAHGSGSGRLSPRNTFVARELQAAGMATLLADLLTPEEEEDRSNVFDVGLLAERLQACTEFAGTEPSTACLPIGFFGASTGGGAALAAAARMGEECRAVVSRGGRPDLAGSALARVISPTLLIVGGADEVVLDLNQRALAALRCEKALRVVPGATHLFEEPGALERVAHLACDWFRTNLPV